MSGSNDSVTLSNGTLGLASSSSINVTATGLSIAATGLVVTGTNDEEMEKAEPLEESLGPGVAAGGRRRDHAVEGAHAPREPWGLGVDEPGGGAVPEAVGPRVGAGEPLPDEVAEPALELIETGGDARLTIGDPARLRQA